MFSTSGPFLDRPQFSRGHWGDFHLICGLFILHQVRMDQTQNGENLCHSTYSLHRLSRLLSFSAPSCGHNKAKSFMILHLTFLISHTICLLYCFFVWSGVQALWSSWVYITWQPCFWHDLPVAIDAIGIRHYPISPIFTEINYHLLTEFPRCKHELLLS